MNYYGKIEVVKPRFHVILTHHAAQRLVERFGCNKDKCQKIADKAFRSKETIPRKFRPFIKEEATYKFYLGCLFVFKNDYMVKLVTVLKDF
jgi:hypothetical protein